MENKNLEKRAEGKYGLDFNSYKSNKQKIQSIKSPIILFLSVVILLSTIAFAIPNSLTIQGKLTNLAGTSQVGTFNFTFKIYDAATAGNELWAAINQSVTTDANGIYDVILGGINLSFAEQYYLGIAVQGENESIPRINLTSAPYSFRANTSEALNPNASYFVRNISIAGHATIGNGTSLIEVSTQSFNFSSTTGNLNINGTVTAKSFVGDGSQLSGISTGQIFNSSGTNVYLNDTNANLGLGISNPSDRLVVIGNVRISGSLNASSINTTGNAYFATSSGNVGVGTISPTEKLTVIGNANISGYLNLSGDLIVNKQFNVTASSGNVNVAGTLDAANLRILGSDVQVEASAWKLLNLTNYFGDASFNATVLRQSNITNIRESLWNLLNLTNYFGDAGFNGSVLRVGNISNIRESTWNFANNESAVLDNATILRTGNISTIFNERNNSLWNVSGSNIYPKFLSGNLGIGTTAPGQTLHVVGSANLTQSVTLANVTISRTTINTTQDNNNNLTISSASGSVIIRLG